MKKGKLTYYKVVLLACIVLAIRAHAASNNTDSIRTLIVFFDGLRPDYITPEGMPNLYAFSKTASVGKSHHSVFPSVTRVNASSYATGAYPGTHGLLGNSVYFPEVDSVKAINTGDASELLKINKKLNGHLLTAVSLGEVLKKYNKEMMVFSSGSTGQALMQNHTVSGAIINPAMILPESFQKTVLNEIGAIPPAAKPNHARHQWITDALLKFGLRLDGPDVSAIWYSDPDGAAHSDGIGSASAVASIKSVDEQFGRILSALKSKGLSDKFNIVISTDHGFVTYIGTENLVDFLIRSGLKKNKDSDDIIVAGGALYVKNHDVSLIQKTVSLLQAENWVGAIFTNGQKKNDLKGFIPGTLSFESIHWNHAERAADILVDANWTDDKNEAGFSGSSYSKGVAGHGSLSPYEITIPLILSGPSFKPSLISELPTSNVDLIPTVLHTLKLPIPNTVDGRVMYEFLSNNQKKFTPGVKNEIIETAVEINKRNYNLILNRSKVGKYTYVNFAKVTRKTN